jgi:hypothetical protein
LRDLTFQKLPLQTKTRFDFKKIMIWLSNHLEIKSLFRFGLAILWRDLTFQKIEGMI